MTAVTYPIKSCTKSCDPSHGWVIDLKLEVFEDGSITAAHSKFDIREWQTSFFVSLQVSEPKQSCSYTVNAV